MKYKHLEIKDLTEKDKGRYVYYKSFDGFELGIIKSWNDKYIFVVYPGNNDSKKIIMINIQPQQPIPKIYFQNH